MQQFARNFWPEAATGGADGRRLRRACSIQKCVRIPPLERVGVSDRHHCFFEMLGFFSFNDFFKADAIQWLWEFYTETCGLPKSRLWVSVWDGDDESFGLWRRHMGDLPEQGHLVRADGSRNFWPRQEQRGNAKILSGPRCHVFFDLDGEGEPPGTNLHGRDRFLGLGDLVFPTMTVSQEAGRLVATSLRNVDFGVGLERLLVALRAAGELSTGQRRCQSRSAFDTALFAGIRQALVVSLFGTANAPADGGAAALLRRAADLTRAAVFCLADGVVPASKGRGHIVRRLLRQAHADGRALVPGGPFLSNVVPAVCAAYGEAYPELLAGASRISVIIAEEERRFIASLAKGRRKLEKTLERLKRQGESHMAMAQASSLSITHGVSLEIIRSALLKHGLRLGEEATC